MKIFFHLIFFLTLSFLINSNFLRKLASSNYDYSNYNSVKTNEDIEEGNTLTSTTADQSVVYITASDKKITNANIVKESGDSSNIENSEFYGVNAAILVNGGKLAISGGTIETKAKGANAICSTNSGEVTITGTTITSTATSSGRGLHATYGGKITASEVTVSSNGGSCATLATDRGEGTVSCSKCTLTTNGAGSPLIYSTGEITVEKTTGTSNGAQAVVVEGKNKAIVMESSDLKCTGVGNRGDVDKCGIMLYQSMSGDADTGTSTFNCASSSIEILSTSTVSSTAPMFFITNTEANINLEGCTFTYGSGIFLSAAGTSEWGTSGSNGGDITLTLSNQQITGNFVVDSSSGLSIVLKQNSKIIGTINSEGTAARLSIKVDSTSSIELTGNSFYTSLEAEDNAKLINGSFTWTQTEEKEISKSSGNNGGGEGGDPPGKPGEGKPGDFPGEGGPDAGKNQTDNFSSSLKSKWKNIIFGLCILLVIV